MVAVKQLVFFLSIISLVILSGLDGMSASPMGMFGGGHHGGDGIAPLLAAGIVISLLQHHHHG